MEDMIFKFSGRDTLKAVKQYIHNGLGLSREDIKKEIRADAQRIAYEAVRDFVINNEVTVEIRKKITDALRSYNPHHSPEYVLAELIKNAIDREVRDQVSAIVKERLEVVVKGRDAQ